MAKQNRYTLAFFAALRLCEEPPRIPRKDAKAQSYARGRYANTHTRQERARSIGFRTRLHGDELLLRPSEGQAGNDRCAARSSRSRDHVIRYRRSLRPLSERGTRGRSAGALPKATRDRDQV